MTLNKVSEMKMDPDHSLLITTQIVRTPLPEGLQERQFPLFLFPYGSGWQPCPPAVSLVISCKVIGVSFCWAHGPSVKVLWGYASEEVFLSPLGTYDTNCYLLSAVCQALYLLLNAPNSILTKLLSPFYWPGTSSLERVNEFAPDRIEIIYICVIINL